MNQIVESSTPRRRADIWKRWAGRSGGLLADLPKGTSDGCWRNRGTGSGRVRVLCRSTLDRGGMMKHGVCVVG